MKKSIGVKRTATYHHWKAPKSKKLFYVIHGYGQLAGDFIEVFRPLEGKAELVAPEGLSRYYNKTKKAVASWMTSHERESEIEDYVNYLELLHGEISRNQQFEKVFLLGYSQGVSTAMRWLANTKVSFERIYLCSGSIPPELSLNDLKSQSNGIFHYFYGDHDPLLTVDKASEQVALLRELTDQVEAKEFKGGHEVSSTSLKLIEAHLSEIN